RICILRYGCSEHQGSVKPKATMKIGYMQVILKILQAAFALTRQVKSVVPFENGTGISSICQEEQWSCSGKHRHLQTLVDTVYPGAIEAAGRRPAVVIPVIYDGFARNCYRLAGGDQSIGDVSCVRLRLHPDTLFNDGIGESEPPGGHRAL